MKLEDLKITDIELKIGRIKTFIIIGDCIRHLVDYEGYGNDTFFVGSPYRRILANTWKLRKEFMVKYNREFSYNISIGSKVSKKLLNEWKKLPNVRVEHSKAPNGKPVINYYYE